MSLATQIAAETQLPEKGVAAAVELFDDGATLPFVARYRKERTGGLDEVQLRSVLDARKRLTELAQRRDTILQTLKEQGDLTDALRRSLERATRKSQLEDLYAPYKRGRATRGDKARELGLEPLARQLLAEDRGHPSQSARPFVRGAVSSTDEALAGARDIVAEILDSENVVHGKSSGADEVIETTRMGFAVLAHALSEPGTATCTSTPNLRRSRKMSFPHRPKPTRPISVMAVSNSR